MGSSHHKFNKGQCDKCEHSSHTQLQAVLSAVITNKEYHHHHHHNLQELLVHWTAKAFTNVVCLPVWCWSCSCWCSHSTFTWCSDCYIYSSSCVASLLCLHCSCAVIRIHMTRQSPFLTLYSQWNTDLQLLSVLYTMMLSFASHSSSLSALGNSQLQYLELQSIRTIFWW